MGLIRGILGLPLAPLRGTVAIAELLRDEAEAQLHDPARIRAELEEVDRLREQGILTEEEATDWEDVLIERLMTPSRDRAGGTA
jgi:cytochrome c-type biogenesis protein CcmH/NrfG